MSKGPEAKVKAACRAWLRSVGAYVYSPVSLGYGPATVDDLVCWRGLFLGIEYKRPDTRPKPTIRQQATLQEIAAAGGATVVAYDLEDVQVRLRALQPYARI